MSLYSVMRKRKVVVEVPVIDARRRQPKATLPPGRRRMPRPPAPPPAIERPDAEWNF